MASNVVVAGVRVGSGIFVPGHGTVLNYPGRFTAAHIKILQESGYRFVPTAMVAPAVSVHSYETYLPPVVPEHLSDERYDDWQGTLDPSADILANNSGSQPGFDTPSLVEEERSVGRKLVASKVVATK